LSNVVAERDASVLEVEQTVEVPDPGAEPLPDPAPPEPCITIDGLEQLQLLSSGRRVSLYRGVQPGIGRTVVAKVLHDGQPPQAAQRFDCERTITGQLAGHADVVELLEAGRTPSGEPYHVTPYYRRGSLARLIGELGPMGWREATFLAESVAVTLAEMHSRGLVHCDVRPSNTMLTDFLSPRLSGFGRALTTGAIPEATDPPPAPFYAPAGSGASPASPADDVHALGALLWAMLAGQAAYPATRIPHNSGLDAPTAIILARQGRLPAAVEPPPEPILDLITRAVSEDPGQRQPDGATFVTALRLAVTEAERIAGEAADRDADGSSPAPPTHPPRPLSSGVTALIEQALALGARTGSGTNAVATTGEPDVGTGRRLGHGWAHWPGRGHRPHKPVRANDPHDETRGTPAPPVFTPASATAPPPPASVAAAVPGAATHLRTGRGHGAGHNHQPDQVRSGDHDHGPEPEPDQGRSRHQGRERDRGPNPRSNRNGSTHESPEPDEVELATIGLGGAAARYVLVMIGCIAGVILVLVGAALIGTS
jgi:hypothetical protein